MDFATPKTGRRAWARLAFAVIAAGIFVAAFLVQDPWTFWEPTLFALAIGAVFVVVITALVVLTGWVVHEHVRPFRDPTAVGAAFVVGAYFVLFARLAFWNSHSWFNLGVRGLPLPVGVVVAAAWTGLVAAPLLAGTGAALAGRWWFERTPRATFAAGVGVLLLVGATVYPVPCDVHESFVDVPNKVCECVGLEVTHYPPFVLDGSATEYCVGIETSPEPG